MSKTSYTAHLKMSTKKFMTKIFKVNKYTN